MLNLGGSEPWEVIMPLFGICLTVAVGYISSVFAALYLGGLYWISPTFLTIAVAAVFVGTVDDGRYSVLVDSGAPYRLPWYRRWSGWKLGHVEDPDGQGIGLLVTNSHHYDRFRGELFPMHWWNDAAVADRMNPQHPGHGRFKEWRAALRS